MSDKNTMSMIDKVLIEMKNGNIDNFEILYELTSKPLLALCYSYTKNVEDSEDALHDTYMKALQQIKKFKGKKGFNWLYTIAKNTLYLPRYLNKVPNVFFIFLGLGPPLGIFFPPGPFPIGGILSLLT